MTQTQANGKTQARVLPDLTAMQAEIARLTAENATLKAATPVRPLTIKLSDKGCVSVYGMGRFPVSLYPGQWVRLSDVMPKVLEYIKANNLPLTKGE